MKTRRGGRRPGGGRPRLLEHRTPKNIGLTDRHRAAVEQWRDRERSERLALGDKRAVSFGDAVEQMIEAASYYYAERAAPQRMRPVSTLLGRVWRSRKCPWVKVDMNTGRLVRCVACRTEQRLTATKFSGLLSGLLEFFDQHRSCGRASVGGGSPE